MEKVVDGDRWTCTMHCRNRTDTISIYGMHTPSQPYYTSNVTHNSKPITQPFFDAYYRTLLSCFVCKSHCKLVMYTLVTLLSTRQFHAYSFVSLLSFIHTLRLMKKAGIQKFLLHPILSTIPLTCAIPLHHHHETDAKANYKAKIMSIIS